MSPSLSQAQLDDIYAFAVELGKQAGKILLDGANARISGTGVTDQQVEKENAVDIVTKTDEGTLFAVLGNLNLVLYLQLR